METRACEEVETVGQSIGALCTLDPFTFSDPDSLVGLQRASARLDYAKTVAFGEFAASGEWALVGASSPVAWAVTRLHLPKPEGHRLFRRAKALAHLALAAEAFAAGDIGAAQFDALAKVRTFATEEAMARDEAMLVGFAKELKYQPFCVALATWAQRVDPDGAEDAEFERRARRDVYLAQSISGMYLGAMTLDPVSGATIYAELKRLEEQLFEEDWAEATERFGSAPQLHDLQRTSAQRRADAMVEMAKRSLATPAGARRPDAHITFVASYDTIRQEICRIQGGPVVTPGTILRHLDAATFELIVFGSGKRAECSPTQRFFTGATRRIIEVRDQACTHAYCDLPAEHCQIDHIVPYSKGGLTEQDNGQVHCGFHNRLRNHELKPPEAGAHGPEPGEGGDHGPEPGESP
jgi:hypothetical protein